MLYLIDEIVGQIDPGYERVENEMIPTEFCPRCGEEIYVGMMDRHNDKNHDPEIDAEIDEYNRKRDLLQAKFAQIVVETMIETAKYSGGEFSAVVLNDKVAEIVNKATRELLEVVEM